MEDLKEIQMRKRNMRLFPIYKTLSWDYLFFYTINFLFLTQIKNIAPTDVLIIDSFYYLFGIIAQIPATFIVEFLGRKNSIIFANVLNAIYMIIIIFSNSLFNLITAEIVSSLAFGMKEIADPSMLNESIPRSKNKSRIFAKINEKGASRYYILNAISIMFAGILFQINGYIPIILSFSIIVVALLISCMFIEPIKKQKVKIEHENIFKELKKGFKFILNSERIKSLLIYAAVITSLLCIMQTYEINLLQDLNISSATIGVIFALLGLISGIASKNQERVHKKFKNKSLQLIATLIVISILVSGVTALFVKNPIIAIIIIISQYLIKHACSGIYYNLIEKYLRNYANEKIDTKIFAVNKLLRSICCATTGLFAAFLLERLDTVYCMIIVSGVFGLIIFLTCKYMKTRVGLMPEQYDEHERKYDELKI